MPNSAFLQQLPCPFTGKATLASGTIKTLTFKGADGVAVFAKRVQIQFATPAGYTGNIYVKRFAQRNAITAGHVDNACQAFVMGGTDLVSGVYVGKIEFLNVDPAATAIDVIITADSDVDISDSTYA